jgi:hypothetical protein
MGWQLLLYASGIADCYMVGDAFFELSYWDLLYHLIFITVLVKKIALEELANATAKPTLKVRTLNY